jgi:hypothetical protein
MERGKFPRQQSTGQQTTGRGSSDAGSKQYSTCSITTDAGTAKGQWLANSMDLVP